MQKTPVQSWVGTIPRRREWLPTLVFLPGEFHGQRSLVGYSPWGHKVSDMTEQLILSLQLPKEKSFKSVNLLLLLLSHFSHVRLCATRPWDSPGRNTGVGCHFLLQFIKVKSESEVAQSCLTLLDPMDCSPPGSSVHGIFQARVLEWGVTADVSIKLCRKE